MTFLTCLLAAAALAPGSASPLGEPAPSVKVIGARPSEVFSAPLPSVQALQATALHPWPRGGGFPPKAHVRDHLCAGDPEMWTRAQAAIEASVRRGATSWDVHETYGDLVRGCGGEACWAVPLAARGRAPVSLPAWLVAARCDSPAAAELFGRADVPPVALAARAREARLGNVRPDPAPARVGAAALERIRTGPEEDRRSAAFDAVASGDPTAMDAIAAMARSAADRTWRKDLYEALRGSDDPRARAAFAPCAGSREAAERCGMDSWFTPAQGPSEEEQHAGDLAWWVRNRNVDDQIDHVAPGKREVLVAALEGCAREDDRGDFYARRARYQCLHGLVRMDRARAVSAAPTLARLPSPEARELLAALTRYPAPGALERRLTELGLLPAGAKAKGLSARELLASVGVVAEFDTETGQFPNEHDTLLRMVWWLRGEGVGGARFEEVPPKDRDDRGPYALRAYVAGKRYEVRAENLGDWWDVGAVVGLLDFVERARGRDRRFVVLATEGQDSAVVAGSEAALRRAIAEGLLVRGSGLDPAIQGKQAEGVVRERLEGGDPALIFLAPSGGR